MSELRRPSVFGVGPLSTGAHFVPVYTSIYMYVYQAHCVPVPG